MKNFFFSAICILFWHVTLAQVPTRHLPEAEQQALLRQVAARPPLPIVKLKKVDTAALLRADALSDGQVFRFGQPLPLAVDLPRAGTWLPAEGGRTCLLTLTSAGAVSLSFVFDKFYLPPGATLYLYNKDRSVAIGPITAAQNNAYKLFATDLLTGSGVTFELFEPATEAGHSVLHLGQAVHGYRTLEGRPARTMSPQAVNAYGSSSSCNVDVNCPDGSAWQTESNAVALVLYQGGRIGTGVLLNDACQSLAPNFLTARHLIRKTGTLTDDDKRQVKTWVVRFRYKSTSCGGGEPNDYVSFSGAQFLAAQEATDFLLVQLNQRPAAGSGIAYAGWSRQGTAPSSVASLHHPAGDVMKIALSTQSVQPVVGHPSFWRATFTTGIVESISSGAPLFDQNHRVVGQLLGDWDASSGSNPCQLHRGDYGRFDLAWTGGGTPDSRLQDWLTSDPTVTQVNTLTTIPVTANAGQTCGQQPTLYTYVPCGTNTEICTDQCVEYGAVPSVIKGRILADDGDSNWSTYNNVVNGSTFAQGNEHEWAQWQKSYDNTNWNDIGGATQASYAPGAITQTTYYRRLSSHIEYHWYGNSRTYWYTSNTVVLTSRPPRPTPASSVYRTCGGVVAVSVAPAPNTSSYNWWVPYAGWAVSTDGNNSFSTYNSNSSFVTTSRNVYIHLPVGVAPGTYSIAVSANGSCGPQTEDATISIIVNSGPGQSISGADWYVASVENCRTTYNIIMPTTPGVTNYRAVVNGFYATTNGVVNSSGTTVTFPVNLRGPQSNVNATVYADGDCGTISTFLPTTDLSARYPGSGCGSEPETQDKTQEPAFYPNPAAGTVSIKGVGQAGQVLFYDAHSILRKTVQLPLNNAQNSIDIQELLPGLYHVRITQAGRPVSNIQFVVNPAN